MSFKWMTNELRDEFEKNDRIAKSKNMNALFELNDDNDFSIILCEILLDKWQDNLDNLSDIEKTLFLCMQLENCSQSDDILSYLQGDFSEYKNETIQALREINAIKSAEIIEQAVKILPETGEWFFKVANANEEEKMDKLNSEFSSYPDGRLCNLIRKYADAHRVELINFKQ